MSRHESALKRGEHWDSHLVGQQIENARFLSAGGLSFELAAERLGMTQEALWMLFRRRDLEWPFKEKPER